MIEFLYKYSLIDVIFLILGLLICIFLEEIECIVRIKVCVFLYRNILFCFMMILNDINDCLIVLNLRLFKEY